MEHVGRVDERVQPDVVVLAPAVGRPAEQVVHLEGVRPVHAQRGHVQVHGRLPGGVRVQVDDDDQEVLAAVGREGALEPPAVTQEVVVVRVVELDVPQVVQCRVLARIRFSSVM